jgi:hypothetical protein
VDQDGSCLLLPCEAFPDDVWSLIELNGWMRRFTLKEWPDVTLSANRKMHADGVPSAMSKTSFEAGTAAVTWRIEHMCRIARDGRGAHIACC